MTLEAPLGGWLSVLAAVPALVLAAKAHGRQIRLERELAGYEDVDFRGENAPFVEALWTRDRRILWPGFGLLLLVAVALAMLRGLPPTPLTGGDAIPAGLLLLGWPFIGAFYVAGLASLARYQRARAAAEPAKVPADAQLAAVRGSVAWWTLAAVVAALWWVPALT
jgi:hypothetical protein